MAGLTYRDAGVDIDAGNALVDAIKPAVAATQRPGVLGGLGGFGALFELPVDRYRQPVLVSGTDGVGTKLRLAIELGDVSGVGIDLVAMCVNDILVGGAEPLFFLDYYATGKLDTEQAATVIRGIAKGCEQAGCALVGGETAEMPGMYAAGDFDLAGFCVGVVERDAILDGSLVRPGDKIIGLASSGVHSNGFSLVRKLIEVSAVDLSAPLPGDDRSLGERLLAPTQIYVRCVHDMLKRAQIHGMAHITGGGLLENIPRSLPKGCQARIDTSRWPQTPLFQWLQQAGDIADEEMLRTFNCGIGMALIVPADAETTVLAVAQEQAIEAWTIGEITAGERQVLITG